MPDTAAANIALTHRWFEEVWNNGNLDTIDELFLPDGQAFGFPEPTSVLTGPEAFKSVVRGFASAFSAIQVHIEDIVTAANTVAVRWSATMTHSGDGLGFPPTGQTVTLEGASFMHLRDGKILNGWNHLDLTRLTLQLQKQALA